ENVEIIRFNQLSALDIDKKISSKEKDNEDREIDKSIIKAEMKLRNKFENLQYINITNNDQLVQQTPMSTVTEIMQNLFFEGIFGVQNQEDMPLDEIA
ncbi:3380_t:CDS:2, partial [Scutellospora calospora]